MEEMRLGRNGWVVFGVDNWFKTWISHRARRSASNLVWRVDFSTTLRANRFLAVESVSWLCTRKTVPMAPLPRTLMALMLSKSKSFWCCWSCGGGGGGGLGKGGGSSIFRERKREGERILRVERRAGFWVL